MLINTEFDNPLEEDIVFEETDETPSFEDILKNSENLIKSFLYLKKMFSSAPELNTVYSFQTIETIELAEIDIAEDTNVIMVKNVKDSNSSIFLNGGELVLLPFESFEFPIHEDDVLEFIGRISIVQTKMTIG
jgi:hypothetical protein